MLNNERATALRSKFTPDDPKIKVAGPQRITGHVQTETRTFARDGSITRKVGVRQLLRLESDCCVL